MLPEFTANEARIIGCLIEKSIVTPDQYPLSLNSLTSACNQKSSRNPVMSLHQGEVQRTVRALENQSLVMVDENFKSRTEKYKHRFCNTRYSDYQFDPSQLAVICLLLLRGPQTPGELRSRSGRLHTFADNAAVVATLDSLISYESGPLVVKLPRKPGRKDSEYMHLLSGPVEVEESPPEVVSETASRSPVADDTTDLEKRVAKLEADVAELRALLSSRENLHNSTAD